MFGFLGDNIDSVKQAAEINNANNEEAEEGSGAEQLLPAGLPGFGGLWSVAKAVQSAVQQTADEVVRSVQETDWKSELTAFTQEVEAEAHKAVEVVQHLPVQLRVSDSDTDAASGDDDSSSSPGGAAHQPTFGVVGSSLASFGMQLISGTKEVIDTVTDMVEGEMATAAREVPRFAAGGKGSSGSGGSEARLSSRQRLATRYSRFEAEVAAMQRDSATYVDEPEDAEDFAAWRSSSFSMAGAQPEVDKILSGNAFMSELQSRLVPLLVEKEDFWARYFYRLHKLQQKEEQRQQLAARAKQLDDQEELGGWDDEEPSHTAAAAAAPHNQQQQQEKDADQQQEADLQQQQLPEPSAAVEQPGKSGSLTGGAGDSASASSTAAAAEGPAAAAAAASAEEAVDAQPPAAANTASISSSTESKSPQQAAVLPPAAQSAAAAAAATAAAAASGVAVVARKVSEDSSLPSTPVQVGSEASDAALQTDTISESSGATAGQGSAAPWTLVAGSAGADKPLQSPPAGAGTAAATAAAGEGAVLSPVASPAKQQGDGGSAAAAAASKGGSGSPAAAAPVVPAPPKAAAATAAVGVNDDDDDDSWGDDADEAVAAVAGSKGAGTGAAAGAAAGAGGEGDDDNWGDWE